jgi:hypothetical protein
MKAARSSVLLLASLHNAIVYADRPLFWQRLTKIQGLPPYVGQTTQSDKN